MSAWIASKEHIDLIITAALAWEFEVREHADERGAMIWSENAASVAHRYKHSPGSHDGETQAAYTYTPYDRGRMDPEVVRNAVKSLMYQSCEHPGWETSQARAWLVPLMEIAEQLMPEFIARFGPIDVGAQAPGQYDWHITRHADGTDEIAGGGWSVDDYDLLLRTEKLRSVASS